MELPGFNDLLPLVCNPNEVTLGWFEANIEIYERLKGRVRNMPELDIFIHVVEEYVKRLTDMQFGYIYQIEKEMDRAVTIAVEVKTFGDKDPKFPCQNKNLPQETSALMQNRGSIVVNNAHKFLSGQVARAESILERAKKLKASI